MATNSFSLSPAAPSDIPILADIFSAAFATDRHTQLKSLGKDPNYQANMMSKGLSYWLQVPARCTLLKATDNFGGKIVGWACWGFHGYEKKQATSVPEEKDVGAEAGMHENQKSKAEEASESHDAHANQGNLLPEVDNIQRLESITNLDMKRWEKILMPEGTKCMILVAIAVSPTYQSLGVGSTLIKWGTQKADIDGVFCWVHASEAGHKMFAKQGFNEVGNLVVDLDEFASLPREEMGGIIGWGHYTFRYMKRLPGPGN
ncbi:hypothetical protein MMC12_001499 [Toensbergia leucococca]|nr:hypothetical protein [Toensbergia leucococca]